MGEVYLSLYPSPGPRGDSVWIRLPPFLDRTRISESHPIFDLPKRLTKLDHKAQHQKTPHLSAKIHHFTAKQRLKSHIVSIHEGKKGFKCTICDARFARKGEMNVHIASVHEGKKPFKSMRTLELVQPFFTSFEF